MTFERTILIVDDEPELASLWGELLGASGWTTRTATRRDAVERALDDGFLPQVLLVDWTLGDTDGGQVIDLVRASAPGVAVIVCSGDESRIPEAVRNAAHGTLRKPFRVQQVGSLLASLPDRQ